MLAVMMRSGLRFLRFKVETIARPKRPSSNSSDRQVVVTDLFVMEVRRNRHDHVGPSGLD